MQSIYEHSGADDPGARDLVLNWLAHSPRNLNDREPGQRLYVPVPMTCLGQSHKKQIQWNIERSRHDPEPEPFLNALRKRRVHKCQQRSQRQKRQRIVRPILQQNSCRTLMAQAPTVVDDVTGGGRAGKQAKEKIGALTRVEPEQQQM